MKSSASGTQFQYLKIKWNKQYSKKKFREMTSLKYSGYLSGTLEKECVEINPKK
jgi:hypothetical protein